MDGGIGSHTRQSVLGASWYIELAISIDSAAMPLNQVPTNLSRHGRSGFLTVKQDGGPL